jgi:tetratricopeptide (TPR) repeat protein
MSILKDYRTTFQVAGVYAAGGWLAFEIVAEVAARLGMPDSVSTAALVLLLIGLPVVVLTSYVQNAAARQRRVVGTDERGLDPTLHPELAASPTPSSAMSRLARVLTWRRSLLTGVSMFALLGLGATGFATAGRLGVGPLATLFSQGVLRAEDPILMADFTSDRDPLLGRTVAEGLRLVLIQGGAIRVADATFVRDALERMQRDASDGVSPDVARLLVQREGLKAFIRGAVSPLGSGYQLTTELVAADGTVLEAFRETALSSSELIDAVDRISNRMRARIGESLRSIRGSEPLARVTTSSLPALSLYTEARRASSTMGDQLGSIELYEQAVALDSTFAMAWIAIGIHLSNLGLRQDDMLEAFRRAYALRERLPEVERWRAIAEYENHVTGDLHAAMGAYRNLLALQPDGSARNNLAVVLRRLRRNDEAEALLIDIPPERRSAPESVNLVVAQFNQGRLADARATIDEMRVHRPDHLLTLNMDVGFAIAVGDHESADRLLDEALARFERNPTARYTILNLQGWMSALRGRVDEALRLLGEAQQVAQRFGLVELQLQVALQAAGAAALLLDDGPRALRLLDDALAHHDRGALPPRAQGHLLAARVAAAAGDAARAAAEVAAYERLVPADNRRAEAADLEEIRAFIDLYAGRAEAALPRLQRLAGEAPCAVCPLPALGRAYESLGQPDSAIAAYARFLETTHMGRFASDAVWRATVLFRLGELHEAAGNADAAIRYYAEFVELWQRADAGLQPRVEAARRRMAALRAG